MCVEIIGLILGGGVGVVLYYLLWLFFEINVMIVLSVFWGVVIGSFFGGGVLGFKVNWGDINDVVGFGGLVGFNMVVGGVVVVSIFWILLWNNIVWMWGGFGIGIVVLMVVYIFYVVEDEYDLWCGLIF